VRIALAGLLAFGYKCPGSHEAVRTDPRVVEDDRAHADQAVRADRAAMEDGTVADGAAPPDRQRRSHVGVEHGVLLDVGPLTNVDQLVVSAQHGPEPDADIAAEPHPADHMRVGRDPEFACGGKLGNDGIETMDRHADDDSPPVRR
jgi:hypothetical protein